MTQCKCVYDKADWSKCAAVKAARDITITDCRTAIYFSTILLGRVKEKCAAMLNFIKAKNQLQYCSRLFLAEMNQSKQQSNNDDFL